MKCTICGHSTMPGAMLCGPCRAALKRARYLSVQVVSPSSMMHGRPGRSRTRVGALAAPLASPSAAKVLAAHAAAIAPGTSSARPPRPMLRTLAIAVAAVAALGVIAWRGQAPERDAVPVAQPAAPARLTAVKVDAAPQAGLAAAAKAPGPAATSVLVSSSPADEAPQPASAARASRAAAPAPARATGPAMVLSAPAAQAYEMVPEPPRPAPVAVTPAPAPPPPAPDRWQTMRDSLARCDREGGLSGFICDQRVRLDSCEGYWGRVPQCPLPPENPR